jgi:glycosyltransferase involved in cell wall biosynthesis
LWAHPNGGFERGECAESTDTNRRAVAPPSNVSEIARLVKGGIRRFCRIPAYCSSAFERASIAAENLFTGDRERLIIIDDYFPSLASAFRIAEINSILSQFRTAVVYSASRDTGVFSQYATCYPQFAKRVRRFHPLRNLKGSAAYIIFLNNIFHYLEYLEKARLPFVLELYPGGGLYLDDAVSDAHLRTVLKSPMFRKVIVTQNVTRDYLLRKNFCEKEQIEFIYGVVVLSDTLAEVIDRRVRFGINKESLDVCFVANKYIPPSVYKGYDRFIASARILNERHPEARFHVVGNFTEEDAELGNLRGRITFYGHQLTPFFPGFYSRMDLIVSPNMPFVALPGSFDGFPTGACVEAALCGTAMFVSDELGMNEGRLKDGKEVVITTCEPEMIAETLETYIADPTELAALGQNGQRAIRRLFSIEAQMTPRLRVLSDLLRIPR